MVKTFQLWNLNEGESSFNRSESKHNESIYQFTATADCERRSFPVTWFSKFKRLVIFQEYWKLFIIVRDRTHVNINDKNTWMSYTWQLPWNKYLNPSFFEKYVTATTRSKAASDFEKPQNALTNVFPFLLLSMKRKTEFSFYYRHQNIMYCSYIIACNQFNAYERRRTSRVEEEKTRKIDDDMSFVMQEKSVNKTKRRNCFHGSGHEKSVIEIMDYFSSCVNFLFVFAVKKEIKWIMLPKNHWDGNFATSFYVFFTYTSDDFVLKDYKLFPAVFNYSHSAARLKSYDFPC